MVSGYQMAGFINVRISNGENTNRLDHFIIKKTFFKILLCIKWYRLADVRISNGWFYKCPDIEWFRPFDNRTNFNTFIYLVARLDRFVKNKYFYDTVLYKTD
jgi:hypothetical protein